MPVLAIVIIAPGQQIRVPQPDKEHFSKLDNQLPYFCRLLLDVIIIEGLRLGHTVLLLRSGTSQCLWEYLEVILHVIFCVLRHTCFPQGHNFNKYTVFIIEPDEVSK